MFPVFCPVLRRRRLREIAITKIDGFGKNIILVFTGTFLGSFFNLLYQLLIAHRLTPPDFAAFNSLLAIFMIVSAPLNMLQLGVAKYAAEFNARRENKNIQSLLSCLSGKILTLAIFSFFVFYLFSRYALVGLNISSPFSGSILAAMVFFAWILPLFTGGLQGLELFKWLVSSSLVGGGLKLILVFIFLALGLNVAGALGALLISTIAGCVIAYMPLRSFILPGAGRGCANFNEVFVYLIPVGISNFCYLSLVSFDMVLVRHFFTPEASGIYSLAQMVGKIFLFLPGAISIVMFPAVSRLNAVNQDTRSTFLRSLIYGTVLCTVAITVYNLFPELILKILTGRAPHESVRLGRMFSISMSFFALIFIFNSYFLSLKDMRFIKFLVIFTALQFMVIALFHDSLFKVQMVLCANSVILFCTFMVLAYKKKGA